MSISDVQKQLCANVGGSFYNGACRCSDGSLKNIYTGKCESEADNPIVPISTSPAVHPLYRSADDMERDDPNGSPLLFGSRERYYATTRAVRSGELGVTGGDRHVATDQGGGGARLEPVELGLRYDPEPVERAEPVRRRTTAAGAQATGTTRAQGTEPTEAATAGVPLALGLGLLSFLIFRS